MPEITDAGLRLAIYARVSTEEQREGQNIDSQIAELERFARDKVWPVVGTYKDDGWSGAVMERPELDRLRDDAQKGVFEAVLINDVDRLARDVAHLGVIKRDLERRGVRVIFRKLPADTSPTSNLMVNILGSFAEFERELIADRTRRGRRHKVEVRKQYLGCNTAYGYRYLPRNQATGQEGVLEVLPEEAGIVRSMFEWVDQEGLSARRVMIRLNERKVPSRKRTVGWGKSSVLRVLHSEMYTGLWHYNKYQSCEPSNPESLPRYRKRKKSALRLRQRAEWIPLELSESLRLVPRERWLRVQQQLARNLAFSPRNEKHAYLLKGLVRCGGCGARYVGDPCHGKHYYRCHARCKRMPTIRESVLNETVKAAVRKVILNPATIIEPLRELDEAAAHEAAERESGLRKAESELAKLATEEHRILDAYRLGMISPEQLGEQLGKIKVRRGLLSLQTAEPEATLPPKEAAKAIEDYCAEAGLNLDSFTNDQWRELLRAIIENIAFTGTGIHIRARIPVPGSDDCRTGAVNVDATLSEVA